MRFPALRHQRICNAIFYSMQNPSERWQDSRVDTRKLSPSLGPISCDEQAEEIAVRLRRLLAQCQLLAGKHT